MFCSEPIIFNEERVYKKTSSFYKLIASFDFIATFVLTRYILDLTLPVTELLQGKEINMADASNLLNSMKNIIPSKLNTGNEFHNSFCRIILETANKVSINEFKPRTATFQTNHKNIPSESVSADYF